MRARLINEISFERRKDPKRALGIGKYALIEKWLIEMGIKNYTINDDFTIDVVGGVNLPALDANKKLKEIPNYIQFNEIFHDDVSYSTSCYFDCRLNRLTSLRGSPKIVHGTFYCMYNKLISLKGAPEIVDGDFYCSHNKLTSLEGAPKIVYGNFHCSYNKLISLEGAPEIVHGDFYCYNNAKKFTKEKVRKYCDVKGYIYV